MPSLFQRILYEITLGYNRTRSAFDRMFGRNKYKWWNEIMIDGKDTGIILGALPLQSQLNILSKKVKGVVSVVDEFENNPAGSWFHSPISPTMWREKGIPQIQFSFRDFHKIPSKKLEEIADEVQQLLTTTHGPIYLHCKAGRRRSVDVITAFLRKYHNLSKDEAHSVILKCRPQALPRM